MIVIIDYGLGNLLSVANAFKFIGEKIKISNNFKDVKEANKLVLPGVGAFSLGIKNLQKSGLIPLLTEEVINNKKPILGICLGMQLLAEKGEEGGIYEGLGWIKNSIVKKIVPKNPSLKIPHVGWDEVNYEVSRKENFLFKNMPKNPDFYFVHSFHLACPKDLITSTFNYGGIFTSSIQKDNILGTQFHPEKSQQNGLRLLKNFSSLKY